MSSGSRLGRAYEHPMDRRSRSSSAHLYQPYHAISEVYTKEVTHHPIGPASEYPPEIIQILREEPRAPREEPEETHTPPLIRSRENTWTPENFPIVRVPSAQFTDILTELYDYHEVNEKFTRRSVSPDVLRRQSEVPQTAPPVPTYQVIPPTPEKNTPRHQGGIPLTSTTSEVQKKPLPMYEEYVRMQKSSSESEALRHIDSSSSESSDAPKIPPQDYKIQIPRVQAKPSTNPEDYEIHIPRAPTKPSESLKNPGDVEKRYVYSHDVYVDSTTGRPYTPGSGDVREKKNCDKLKINVYFKPPHPPVEATYKLDEIEIEKHEDILVSKLRPSRSATILSRSASSNPSVPLNSSTTEMYPQEHFRRIPTSTSILRREHEILTVPLNRSQSVRQSRVSEHSARRSASKTISQRSIPIHVDNASINMDEVFPKMPHHQTVTNVQAYPSTRSTSTVSRGGVAIDKGDYPKRVPSMVSSHKSSHAPTERGHGTPELQFTRGISKTPSVQEYRTKKPAERSPSFISSSHGPTHKSERTPSEVRIPVTQAPPTYQRPQEKRQSPEELDYGRFPNSRSTEDQTRGVKELPYTRGVSKTPSDKERISSSSHVHIPYNHSDKERAYQNSIAPKPAPSARSSYRSELTEKSATPELPYTRGISKTPSDNKEYKTPKKASEVHIPYNNPEKERAYQQEQRSPKPTAKPHKSRPMGSQQPQQSPYEEIVHIKERYERDETIRRFFPTTTTV